MLQGPITLLFCISRDTRVHTLLKSMKYYELMVERLTELSLRKTSDFKKVADQCTKILVQLEVRFHRNFVGNRRKIR